MTTTGKISLWGCAFMFVGVLLVFAGPASGKTAILYLGRLSALLGACCYLGSVIARRILDTGRLTPQKRDNGVSPSP